MAISALTYPTTLHRPVGQLCEHDRHWERQGSLRQRQPDVLHEDPQQPERPQSDPSVRRHRRLERFEALLPGVRPRRRCGQREHDQHAGHGAELGPQQHRGHSMRAEDGDLWRSHRLASTDTGQSTAAPHRHHSADHHGQRLRQRLASHPGDGQLLGQRSGANASGVAYTEYSLDGGAWTRATSLTIAAPRGRDRAHHPVPLGRQRAGAERGSGAELRREDRHQAPQRLDEAQQGRCGRLLPERDRHLGHQRRHPDALRGAPERLDSRLGPVAGLRHTAAVKLPAPDGTKKVWAQYRDAANNGYVTTDTILLDRVAPRGAMKINGAPRPPDRCTSQPVRRSPVPARCASRC